jgi:hypothetical protein
MAARAATGGTKRSTVPALPTSTRASFAGRPGVTRQVPGVAPVSMPVPRAASAPAIRSVSLARSGRVMALGPSASAARTSARLVMDFEPGSVTLARTGRSAAGARQRGPSRPDACCGFMQRA